MGQTDTGAIYKYPHDKPIDSLLSVLMERAEEIPHRVYLRDVDGDSATYREALTRSLRWCGAFQALGVGPGDRVLTMIPNCIEAVVVWLGIAAAGAVEGPVHLAYKGNILTHAVRSISPRVIVATHASLEHLLPVAAEVSSVESIILIGPSPAPIRNITGIGIHLSDDLLQDTEQSAVAHVPAFHDTAVLLLTSGTTGVSKPVIVPWGQLQVTAQGSLVYADLHCDDVIYTYTPWSHVGSRAHVYLAALLGGVDVLRSAFSTESFLPDVRDYGITSAALLGAMAHFLMGLPAAEEASAGLTLRNIVMLPLLPDLAEFERRFQVRVYTGFGMTELAIPIRGNGWSTENPAAAGYAWDGWPYFELRLVDEFDQEVETGAVGELVVRSGYPWTISPGYFGMPEATAQAWRNGWFHTGDLFRRDVEGAYYFVDRGKDCIRRRGENISSFEVEAAALQHPSVIDAAAVAASSPLSEDEVRLFVVLRPDHHVTGSELHRYLEDSLPRFMVPRYVDFVDSLPKTETLRTKKHELRAVPIGDGTWDHLAEASPSGGILTS